MKKENLIKEFEEEMKNLVPQMSKAGYKTFTLERMVANHGYYESAKRLIANTEGSGGFKKLAFEKNKPELTIEHLALKDKYSPIFTATELQIANWKLTNTSDL